MEFEAVAGVEVAATVRATPGRAILLSEMMTLKSVWWRTTRTLSPRVTRECLLLRRIQLRFIVEVEAVSHRVGRHARGHKGGGFFLTRELLAKSVPQFTRIYSSCIFGHYIMQLMLLLLVTRINMAGDDRRSGNLHCHHCNGDVLDLSSRILERYFQHVRTKSISHCQINKFPSNVPSNTCLPRDISGHSLTVHLRS